MIFLLPRERSETGGGGAAYSEAERRDGGGERRGFVQTQSPSAFALSGRKILAMVRSALERASNRAPRQEVLK